MNDQLTVIYRCCELETGARIKRPCRPSWFSKEMCLFNLLDTFKDFKIIAVHDGPSDKLDSILKIQNNVEIVKIEHQSNLASLQTCLNIAKDVKTENIYFVEDDYLHRTNAADVLLSGLSLNPLVTLYDHEDRYTRTDDANYGQIHVFRDKYTHWRTTESTTCTWACTKDMYKKIHDRAYSFGLQDRGFWISLYNEGHDLISPMPGYSTHCHEPFLSPFINWETINDTTRFVQNT